MKNLKFSLLIAVVILTLVLCACAPYHHEAHGFNDYKYPGRLNRGVDFNSEFETDEFTGITSLINDYPYADADYWYSYTEDSPYYNILDRGLYYFEYETNEDYQVAKSYCKNSIGYLSDEITEEYNGYLFYDYYAKYQEAYPEQNYDPTKNFPEDFKRVAFNDQRRAIVVFGIYTSDKHNVEISEDVLDWGGFLHKYFFEYYDFGE